MKTTPKSIITKSILASTIVAAGILAVVPSVTGQGIGLRKLDSLMISSKSRILRGKKVYKANCTNCHGDTGSGTAFSENQDPKPTNLATASYRYGGGPIQVYNLLSKGNANHKAFKHVAYQDLWAVTHFVRSLGPTSGLTDSAEVVAKAKFEAENGTCDESLKAGISEKVKPKGAAQIEKGKKVFNDNGCFGCHGKDGAGVTPDARKFSNAEEKWVNGSSELGIFDSITNGVNTGMAAYASIPEDDRWALVHYIRTFVPEKAKQTSTSEQIDAVCRSLSVPPKPESISVEQAMKFMVDDAADARETRMSQFGTAMLNKGGNKAHGKELYSAFCQKCHGVDGVGSPALGPFGAYPPYLFLQVGRLNPQSVGGSYTDFAYRASSGSHTTLGEMTPISHLSKKDWISLQTYIAQDFKGSGKWEFVGNNELSYSSSLPSGFALKAADNGIESKIITFVSDASKVVDKKTWFDFDRLTFNTGSANLDLSKSKSQLVNIYEIFKAYPNISAKLGGYTDNTGDAGKNMKLSQKRAENVMAQLVSMGVEKGRLEAEGYGQQHPVCPANDTAACKRQNRRISLRITKK